MSEWTGVSEDLDSEGCLSSIKSSTTERTKSEPERIKIPQHEKVICGGGGGGGCNWKIASALVPF